MNGLWNLLFISLLLFPLLTGGIWIHRPHLFLELADPAVPVLLLSALAWGMRRFARKDISSTWAIQKLTGLGDRFRTSLDKSPGKTLTLGSLLFGWIHAWASLRRHWSFGSNSFDLGIFTNALWNLTHGNGYISTPKDGANLFIDHQSPILWAFAPVFQLFPHPETLLILQGLILAATAIPLYWVARQYLSRSDWRLAAVPLVYWAYLPIRNANSFDFHPEVLMLPLFLGAIAGLQSKEAIHRAAGAVSLLLALLCKESAGAVAAGVGLAWALGAAPRESQNFCRRISPLAILLGVAAFLIDTKLVPRLFGGAYFYQDLYEPLGSSFTQILLSPFTQPALFFQTLLAPSRLHFLFWTLGPLGFVSLAYPRALIAALPGYLMLFLSHGDHRVNLDYHYVVEPGVGILWAWVAGLAAVGRARISPKALQAWVLFWALLLFGRSDFYRIRSQSPDAHDLWLEHKLLTQVPQQMRVAATDSLVPHLSTRYWAHNLTRVLMADGKPVDCLIIDSARMNWPMSSEELASLVRSLPSSGFRLVYSCGSVSVHSSGSKSCLAFPPSCLP